MAKTDGMRALIAIEFRQAYSVPKTLFVFSEALVGSFWTRNPTVERSL